MTINRATTCCFTGHRNIPSYLYDDVRKCIYGVAEQLIRSGVNTFISGVAMGFDLIAAEAIVQLKARYPHIMLAFAIPCPEHYAKWPKEDVLRYDALCLYCDYAYMVSAEYTDGCMLKRDRDMVDKSSYCISYCTRRSGGTAYTVRYAEANGLNRIEISQSVLEGRY